MVLRSSISCWRSGDLSMERPNSRMLHGAGFRRATRPSLSISTSWKPRGRSFCRMSVAVFGSASVIKSTSRSARSSVRSAKRSSWCRKFGSFGLSAKITTGRATQIKSFKFISDASNIAVLSASHCSTVAFSADAENAANNRNINGMVRKAVLIIPMNIGFHFGESKARVGTYTNNFIIKPSLRSECT